MMGSPNTRRQRPPGKQAAPAPVPEPPPPRPEILSIDARHLVWRASQRPAPAEPRRPITWDIRAEGEILSLRADLDREGEMREVDFREVHCRLNDVILTETQIQSGHTTHIGRLRQSLLWQRKPDARDRHFTPCHYDEELGYWLFAAAMACRDPDQADPLDQPVLRPASNQMMIERREERLWAASRARLCRWTSCLDFAADIHMRNQICRARVLHYWRIRECRELFSSSQPFAAVFATPGLLPELDAPGDPNWRETATRLARLPRREWMERLGLPPTQQVVRLFSRLHPYLVATELPHIREVFADPDARKRLSDTTCTIPDFLLNYFRHPPVLRWPLMRSLCRRPGLPHWMISRVMFQMDFFRDEPLCGPYLLKHYRRARNLDEIDKVIGFTVWLRSYWNGLFQPGVCEAVSRTTPPLPETPTIRHLNRPQELLQLSGVHNLCLEKFIQPIIHGEYALYRIDYHDQFAVAGIKREANGPWQLDDIRGARNADAPEEVRGHFIGWLETAISHHSTRNPAAP